MLTDGKRYLITGVLTPGSIAYAVAQQAQQQGAEILLTGWGRSLSLTQKTARRLPTPVDVLELDVTQPDQVATVHAELERRWGKLDGVLHAIAFAPQDALGGNFLTAPYESVATAFQVSAFSLKTLTVGLAPLLRAAGGGSVVSLDFDASVAWPAYDWMGPCKAALESVTRYLARELGGDQIRVNTVAAGPVRTMAAKSIPGFERFEQVWAERAPLGWDVTDPSPVAQAVLFLLSAGSKGITGEILHVDGGYHAIGA
ncbi:MAG TPA: enoyl-ACP reductase FabI [Actinomycetes bacterium]|jgi:enoyl-[acyl-carrier protein] reductase I|nr:enoyl-ACP reductase FabI [Actinomycetes bacterium]